MIIPVVLCGGSGSRLWPLSSSDNPKQFLKLLSDKSLLQDTVIRALNITGAAPETVVTVTVADQVAKLREDYTALNSGLLNNIIAEERPRNTAAAVLMAARHVRDRYPGKDPIMLVLSADAHIADENGLKSALAKAVKLAEQHYIVTFGASPTHPETGYGYIQRGEKLGDTGYKVRNFEEKPNAETAENYLNSGDHLWNTGMFLFKLSAVLKAYEIYASDIVQNLDNNNWNREDAIPFDKAILERADNIAVVPHDIGWSDIGNWRNLWQAADKDGAGNHIEGDVILADTNDNFIIGKKKQVFCAGIDNLVIIETEDKILVADKNNQSAFKKLLALLPKTALLLSLAFLSACADLKTAQRAEESGDFAVAEQNYRELAEFGIPEAQLKYASFLNRHGTNEDQRRILIAQLNKALENDSENTKIHMALGKLYEAQKPADYASAFSNYKKAYQLGDKSAAYSTGSMLARADRSREAINWLEIALNNGDARAARALGRIYEKRNDVPVDLHKALSYYRYAAAQDVEGAEQNVARVEKKLQKQQHPKKQRTKSAKLVVQETIPEQSVTSPSETDESETPTGFGEPQANDADDNSKDWDNLDTDIPDVKKPIAKQNQKPKQNLDHAFDDYDY